MREIITWLNDNILWGIPMLVLMLGTGLFLTVRTRGVLLWRFGAVMGSVLRSLAGKTTPKGGGQGTITPFQAVCTALAATVGTGNIVGIAVAIRLGGPGSIFWMWVCAVLGMVTKFCETTLSVAYREKNGRGEIVGGPMYYMEKGLGWKKAARVFCVFAVIASLGVGNMVQANAVAGGLKSTFGVSPRLTGAVLALLVGLVILGGIRRISSVAEKLVPLMAIVYIGACAAVLVAYRDRLPDAWQQIIQGAFNGSAAAGGFAGSAFLYTVRIGVARGVFTNEAGLGSAPIAHAGACTDHPARQGCLGAFEVFFDTMVMCTVTALAIISSGLWTDPAIDGGGLSLAVFSKAWTGGGYVVTLCVVLFAFATIIAWYYYAEKALEYITTGNALRWYRLAFVSMVFVGCVAEVNAVWELADLFNGLMAIPNLCALVALSATATRLAHNFFSNPRQLRSPNASYRFLMQTPPRGQNGRHKSKRAFVLLHPGASLRRR